MDGLLRGRRFRSPREAKPHINFVSSNESIALRTFPDSLAIQVVTIDCSSCICVPYSSSTMPSILTPIWQFLNAGMLLDVTKFENVRLSEAHGSARSDMVKVAGMRASNLEAQNLDQIERGKSLQVFPRPPFGDGDGAQLQAAAAAPLRLTAFSLELSSEVQFTEDQGVKC